MIEYENLGKLNRLFYDEYQKGFKDLLDSGWFILGKSVETFEKSFAEYCGTKHCVGVASGLDALLFALKVLDLPEKSEVIVPSNTYIATILAILQAGHIPVLVEPKIETYNIDASRIEDAITPNTRAVMIVHLYGQPCEMDKIQEICKKRNLHLIEDCAQAHGAKFKNQKVGSFGIGAFSFYPTKNLGALGDAGGITTNSEEHSQYFKMIRNYGSKMKYHNEMVGYNSRLDETQAVFLNIKLKKLDEINKHKRKLAHVYFDNLDSSKFVLPHRDPNIFEVFHIFNIRNEKRDLLKEYLLKKEVKTEVHYPVSPHRQNALKDVIKKYDYPISEEIHKTTLSLPISYFHTEEDVLKVCNIVNNF